MTTIFTTVVASLLLAGIYALLRSHWLYLVVPKLFLHTPLSPSGQVVSLTLVNSGLIGEEDVSIQLKESGRYELLASSKSTLTFTKNMLVLPRLSRRETVSVLLLVEGKTFDQADVQSVESRQATGKIVDKKEQILPLWKHLVVLIGLFAFALELFQVGSMFGSHLGLSAFDYVTATMQPESPSKQLAGYKIKSTETLALGNLQRAWTDGRVRATFDEVVRRDDIITINLTLENNTSEPLSISVSTHSSADGKSPLAFQEGRIDDMFVGPNAKKSGQLKVFLPETATPRLVINKYRFESGGSTLYVDQTLTF